MSKVFIEESTLTSIGDAIRSQTGDTELISPSAMAREIAAIPSGEKGLYDYIPEEVFTLSGGCSYRFAKNGWNWFVERYGDYITTESIMSADYMFSHSLDLTSIPFDINCANNYYYDFSFMFAYNEKLTSIGKIKNAYPSSMQSMFSSCKKLRYLPEFENLNTSRINTYSYANISNMFNSCFSLRSIPEDLLKKLYLGTATTASYHIFYNGFEKCYALDEIRGLNPQTGIVTSNMFGGTFKECYRLKDVIFATQDDGTPYTVSWKNQTIDLSKVGYSGNSNNITNNNSGITEDKRVYHDPTLEPKEALITKLKDDPDWFTNDYRFSRYNRYSAANTINTLPDTSAYLASAGGTNTIKFSGNNGAYSGGLNEDSTIYNHIYNAGYGIEALTEEEIAVATAKGWTVTM